MSKVTITEAVQVLSADPTRRGKHDLMVQYNVDGTGFYILNIPMEELVDPAGKVDPKKLQAKITDAEKERLRLVGMEFVV